MPDQQQSNQQAREEYFKVFGYYPDDVPPNPNIPNPPEEE